jgi:hypothetical protein
VSVPIARSAERARVRTASACRYVSDSLYSPQERVAREPLTAWSQRLLSQMRSAVDESGQLCDIALAANCFNQAALVELFRGKMRSARQLCRSHLRWQLEGRRPPPSLPHGSAIQPFINLIRLDVLGGKDVHALASFAALDLARKGIRSAGCSCGSPIPEMLVELVSQNAEAAEIVETVFVIDSLKTLLRSGTPASIAEFCDRNAPGRPAMLSPFFTEARMIAVGRLGDYSSASGLADIEAQRNPELLLVFLVRLIELALFTEQPKRAVQQLLNPSLKIADAILATAPEIVSLGLIWRLALLVRMVGDANEALRIAQCVLARARAVNDEPFEVEVLAFLSRCASQSGDRSTWRSLLSLKLGETEYVGLRRRFREHYLPICSPNDRIGRDVFAPLLSWAAHARGSRYQKIALGDDPT